MCTSVSGIQQLPCCIACLAPSSTAPQRPTPPHLRPDLLPHDHKAPKYKLGELNYRSHRVDACFWGTNVLEKAGLHIFVNRWVTVNFWISTIKTVGDRIRLTLAAIKAPGVLLTVISWSLPRPPALFPWHSCGFLIPWRWWQGRGGGRRGSCSSQGCLG